ncbi:MAG: glycosyltransferase family 2 protein [Deltaproteobacteria bacterium]|nr:glycosyltransferase family 2 protein [Deltaproteobacteria bacterium]
MNGKHLPALAIIIPCFNEESIFAYCLKTLLLKLDKLIQAGKISDASFLLFVDDGSQDGTWQLIKNAGRDSRQVKGVKLSRNQGHQIALWAGLRVAQSDVTISIDADLQDDVNAIDRMVDCFHAGKEVVYGIRQDRSSDSYLKRTSASLFYGLMQKIGVQQVVNHADFRLLSNRAKEALLSFKESNLYIRGLVPMIGFETAEVSYVRGRRAAGETKYPLSKMLQLAVNGITSLSVTPLRIIALSGLLISLLSVAAAVWAIVNKLNGGTVQGWASVMIAIFFLGGVQVLSIGVIGEYIGKIYLESKARPKYFIEEMVGK